MARFRVGNVRFGGGRKASVGFHGFGVGVTLGGGRKGGGGGGGGGAGWTGLGQRMKTFWLMTGKHPALILLMAFSF